MHTSQLLTIISLASNAFAADGYGICHLDNGPPGVCNFGGGVVIPCHRTYPCIKRNNRQCKSGIDYDTHLRIAYCSSL
ncbi:unnamed protein product [Zymoseptoria tritici ST99CH_1A5]|uniref:Uncharacterized protein n=1 Tax=Zymoseptoria tritici ST99CH_1A5 TaxID=1276529 RepID=A0A1Y6L748_ZYMTR|nr:unnamed protein product [Zymoseptoria tritici ST99CH_1A5]